MKKSKRSWLVDYRRTCQGTTVVAADTALEAELLVQQGDFEHDTAEEMVDWGVEGKAEENI